MINLFAISVSLAASLGFLVGILERYSHAYVIAAGLGIVQALGLYLIVGGDFLLSDEGTPQNWISELSWLVVVSAFIAVSGVVAQRLVGPGRSH